ncbi:MAG: DUF4184 family protein [Proteobacteria bacterium]|nr:DUF4184 family protein [Pseudomonadota bacterium]
MPFTLAHPAAVLPLRRWTHLHIAPLIIGAMVPDAPHFLPGRLGLTMPETHSLTGVWTVCLALGYLLLLAAVFLRRPLTALLPHRAHALCLQAVEPFRSGVVPWLLAAPAIVIGAWTHVAWDSATHGFGWIVQHVPVLATALAVGPFQLPLYRLLQYASSVAGLAVMLWWYLRLPSPAGQAAGGDAAPGVRPLLLLLTAAALLVGAVQAVEHYLAAPTIYRTLDVFLTRSLAWFLVFYLLAGLLTPRAQAH